MSTLYAGFLDFAGFSHFHFVVMLSLPLSLLLLYLCQTHFGILHKVQFENKTFKSSRILYTNHKGAYQKLGGIFQKTGSDCNEVFKVSKLFGIFYDNPKQLSDQSLARSTIGILVNNGETHKIEEFMQKNPQYFSCTLPSSACISSSHPYVNPLSFILIVNKVYPKLTEYLKKNELETAEVIMEIYHFLGNQKWVETMAPLQNFHSFRLWRDCVE